MPDVSNPTGKHARKRRHPGEGTVVARKDHRYRRFRWAAVFSQTVDGKRTQVWYSAVSREDAERIRKDEAKRRAASLHYREVTVAEYVTEWLADRDIRPASALRYQQHFERRIRPSLGNVDLGRLSAPDIRAALRSWGSASARRQTLTVLGAALRQAVRDRLIEHNPVDAVPRPKHEARQRAVIGPAEAREIIALFEGHPLHDLVLLALTTGLRRGELLGLRWADVGPSSLTVTHSLVRTPPAIRDKGEGPTRLVKPKSKGSNRVIPLPAVALEALARISTRQDEARRRARVWAENDLVFTDARGNPLWPMTVTRQFEEVVGYRWRLHDLRAGYATILAARGVHPRVAQALLGHADVGLTMSVYTSALDEQLRGAAEAVGEAVS